MLIALAQLSPLEGLIRLTSPAAPAPAVPVMNHLAPLLNVSFTLPQPEAALLIAH
jgi:hypothetical protein